MYKFCWTHRHSYLCIYYKMNKFCTTLTLPMPVPSPGEKGGGLCIVHVKVFEVDGGVKFKFLYRSI